MSVQVARRSTVGGGLRQSSRQGGARGATAASNLRLRRQSMMYVLRFTQCRDRTVRDLPWQADAKFGPLPMSRSTTERGGGARFCSVQC